MKLHEYQSKQIFANYGIPIPKGRVAATATQAKEIAQKQKSQRINEGGSTFGTVTDRKPLGSSFDARRGKRDVKIDAKGAETILFGQTAIDLGCLEQLVDMSQTRAIGHLIHCYGKAYLDRTANLREGLEGVLDDVVEKGLDMLLPFKTGNLALPRIFEVAGAINRMRTLRIVQIR